jgi:predicted RNA-binding protein (virulence factor B family)
MRIGEYQEMWVERETIHGLYLSDGEAEVLLPRGQAPARGSFEGKLRVFVYTDSEDRPVATIKQPKAAVGEFATMRCVAVTPAGAFLDWGIDKDLFCPTREQARPMREGYHYLVKVYLDERSNRVVATSRIGRLLRGTGEEFTVGQKLSGIVYEVQHDYIGVILNNRVRGTLYPDEWHEELRAGDAIEVYVKQVREDGKVALSLRPQGYESVLEERDRILEAVRRAGGFLGVSDKTSPGEIQRRFGLSKGAFKKLIGTLYREGVIRIEAGGIRLV